MTVTVVIRVGSAGGAAVGLVTPFCQDGRTLRCLCRGDRAAAKARGAAISSTCPPSASRATSCARGTALRGVLPSSSFPPLMVDAAADNDTLTTATVVSRDGASVVGGDDSDPSEASSSDSDETMSMSSSVSCAALLTLPLPPPVSRGMTFNKQVRVLPIPPIEDFTAEQLYRKYTIRFELRENKARNKRENATEENAMAICPLSGELLHPAHL
ncbi:hypothetical protein ACHAW5_005531 [Stephanodiscus triporus]|uniref:Uncharacterized protein n=1 Tax=Stephanodiscus triporus TaxID=2934178 RepID=A0ABD3NKW2_9STRA